MCGAVSVSCIHAAVVGVWGGGGRHVRVRDLRPSLLCSKSKRRIYLTLSLYNIARTQNDDGNKLEAAHHNNRSPALLLRVLSPWLVASPLPCRPLPSACVPVRGLVVVVTRSAMDGTRRGTQRSASYILFDLPPYDCIPRILA